MLLCDAAQVADGKLYILGGGWSMTGPGPRALGRGAQDRRGLARGRAFAPLGAVLGGCRRASGADGDHRGQPAGRGARRVHREPPPGIPEGSPIDVALAVNLGPIPLAPGTRFAWRLTIDGESLPGSLARVHHPPAPAVRLAE